jgi:hypothetical protein
MSVSDILQQATGAYGAFFLLILICSLWMSRKVVLPAELDTAEKRRQEENAYRDALIERQSKQIEQLQNNFETALRTIREDVLPLVDKALAELQKRA